MPRRRDPSEKPGEPTKRLGLGGHPPVSAAVLHVRIPDDGTREAVIERADAAGVTINDWMVAAVKAALASPSVLQLPTSSEVRKAKKAAAIKAERHRRQELARQKKANRLAAVVRLRKEGLTESAIAKALGMSESALSHFLKYANMRLQR